MLTDHIKNIILEKFKFKPTSDQDHLISGLSAFLMDHNPAKSFSDKRLCRYR